MMRQASVRNQRNKGPRLKNFLQICILTLVFFWLLYQLKRSFDEKKGPDEHRSRSSNNVIDSHSEFAVLGRKALPHDDRGIVSEGKVSNEDEEDGESQHTMGDEEVKEIPEDGIDELDNEQEDEQDEEVEDGDDALNEEEKDEQVEEAEFLDDQDPEEDSSLDRDRSKNSTITDLVALQNDIDYNNSLTTSGSAVEKLEQEVSPIDHSKLKGNLLTAGVLDVQVNRQTNETLGKNNLLPLGNEALIKSIDDNVAEGHSAKDSRNVRSTLTRQVKHVSSSVM